MSTHIKDTLVQRGSRYGKFSGGALLTQEMKTIARGSNNWELLSVSQKEAIEMILHKISRILNGDPNYSDSWVDIEGYAHLVSEELAENKNQQIFDFEEGEHAN